MTLTCLDALTGELLDNLALAAYETDAGKVVVNNGVLSFQGEAGLIEFDSVKHRLELTMATGNTFCNQTPYQGDLAYLGSAMMRLADELLDIYSQDVLSKRELRHAC